MFAFQMSLIAGLSPPTRVKEDTFWNCLLASDCCRRKLCEHKWPAFTLWQHSERQYLYSCTIT